MRLRTLPVSMAGVAVAVGFAEAHGTLVPWVAAVCLFFALLCQIASNFANEYFDYKAGRDAPGREGPRRGVTEGDITPGAMKAAITLTLILSALAGLSLAWHAGWWLIAAGVAIGLGAIAYSAGPYPMSTHCLGEVAVILFFGIIPVNLTYYVQALDWNTSVFATSIAIGLMGANVLIVNNVRDIPDDRSVGKHTLATAIGPKACAVLYALNAVAGVALTFPEWMSANELWTIVPGIYAGISLALSVLLVNRKGRSLTPLLGITSILMFLFATALAAALITRTTAP